MAIKPNAPRKRAARSGDAAARLCRRCRAEMKSGIEPGVGLIEIPPATVAAHQAIEAPGAGRPTLKPGKRIAS
jgi:hypothetical protein